MSRCSATRPKLRSGRRNRDRHPSVVAALDLAEQLGVPVEWFAVRRGPRTPWMRHPENMDWVSRVLPPHNRVHPGRWRDQRDRPAINVGAQPYWNVGGDHAHAHSGHFGHDPRQRHGPDRQQPWSTRAASPRKTTSVSAATTPSWGRTARPNTGPPIWPARWEILFAHYFYSYVAPGETLPRPVVTDDPVERDVRTHPQHVDVCRVRFGRRHLLARHQPGPQEAVRHPHPDTGHCRPGPSAARTLARHERTPKPRSSSTPASAAGPSAS